MDSEQGLAEYPTLKLDGFQVVRREFLSRINVPVITFGNFKVWVNAACLRNLPEVNCIQFLIAPKERKLILRSCSENEKDSFFWCVNKENIRKPRKLICRLFCVKLSELMGWNPECRYRIIGNLVSAGSEKLLFFDLNSSEMIIAAEKNRKNEISFSGFPKDWQNSFGPTSEEHGRIEQISIFEDYTVFTLENLKENDNG